MDHLPISRSRRLHNGFAHGRVGVDGLDYFVAGGFQFAGHHDFGNHLRHVCANHVRAEQFAVFFVKNELHKTF
jgi:hypothetical protein